jgi:CRP-like cAMP-binding protein/SAM-dependent methyltransferase
MDWYLSMGNERTLEEGHALISQGDEVRSLYQVLTGVVGVYLDADRGIRAASLGPGEIVGELSYLDGRPASATVVAAEKTTILEIPLASLEQRIAQDPAFAVGFFRSLGGTVSHRLRALQHSLVKGDATEAASVERPILDKLAAFKSFVREVDQRAIKNDGEVVAEDTEAMRSGFADFCAFINQRIGDASGLAEVTRAQIGARLQQEVLPYMLMSESGERWYSKPRGYAGDFMTIEIMYRDEPHGSGRLGPSLDRCFLDVPAAQAVRNRRGLLAGEIAAAIERKKGEKALVASFACGPARELFDVYGTLSDPKALRSTLIDIDLQALAFVADARDKMKLGKSMQLLSENLVYLATGRRRIDLKDQDLIYSIGLIDYFPDKFVVALLNYIHDALRPGGRVILGNFHPRNPTKALQDYILDWELIHRDEDDMNRLLSASKFASPCSRILYEEQRINLFAEGVKAETA